MGIHRHLRALNRGAARARASIVTPDRRTICTISRISSASSFEYTAEGRFGLPTNQGGDPSCGLISGIWLAVLGVLGASSLIIAKRPDAKEAIAKLAPYQGWIGAVSAVWGVWGIISSVLTIGWLSTWPIYWDDS